jgi:copper(I)-binding protein
VKRVDASLSESHSNRRTAGVSVSVVALAAGALISTVALTGCGTGQLSQTASMESAVDGGQAVIDDKVALRNVHIQAQQNRDYLEPGKTVDLVLVVTNQSPDVTDKLVSISTDIGKVTVTGDATLPAGGTLFVGTPNGQNRKALDAVEAADNVKATVQLSKPITNGLNYNFTFDFEKAGTTSLAVPISAGEAPRQGEPAPPVLQP